MNDDEVRQLLDVVYHQFHYDFGYSFASIRRRVEAAIWRLGFSDVASLQQALLVRPTTFSALLRYLTVHVSELFRDPAFFRSFREHIVPELKTYPSLRIWVAGCSTGEEAYSVAIVLREEGLLERSLIYATDIHPEALAIGESGIYPADRFVRFGENYRLAGGRHVGRAHHNGAARVGGLRQALRTKILFADPPASRPTACSPRCTLLSAATCSSTSVRPSARAPLASFMRRCAGAAFWVSGPSRVSSRPGRGSSSGGSTLVRDGIES